MTRCWSPDSRQVAVHSFCSIVRIALTWFESRFVRNPFVCVFCFFAKTQRPDFGIIVKCLELICIESPIEDAVGRLFWCGFCVFVVLCAICDEVCNSVVCLIV